MSLFERTEKIFVQLASLVAIIGGMGLLFATLVTCISILLKLARRILDALFPNPETISWEFIRPILGEEELVTYGVGFALYCALPWVIIQKGHIKIELFANLFNKRFNQFLDFLGDVAFTAIAYLILSQQWFLIFRKARRSEETLWVEIFQGNFAVIGARLRDNQVSQILSFPLWPTYIVAEICALLFFIVALFCAFRSAKILYEGNRA